MLQRGMFKGLIGFFVLFEDFMNFFSIPFSRLSRDDLIINLFDNRKNPFTYVVTPNLDHLVKLHSDQGFCCSYKSAGFIVPDGWPLSLFSKISGFYIGELFPGSEIVPCLFDYSFENNIPIKVYLLGSPPGVNEIAKSNIESRWNSVDICGSSCPSFGFIKDADICAAIVDDINKCNPDFIIFGLGAPLQENFCHQYSVLVNSGIGLCVGATTEFLAETVKRAPPLLRKFKLEWAYRWYSQPMRLTKRYLLCLYIMPCLLYFSFLFRLRLVFGMVK